MNSTILSLIIMVALMIPWSIITFAFDIHPIIHYGVAFAVGWYSWDIAEWWLGIHSF
jgi:hypothetical protein